MFAKSVFARQTLVILIIFLSLIARASTWDVSVSLAWNPSTSPAVMDYQVFYGLASSNYTWSVDAGDSTNFTVSGLTPGLTYYMAVLGFDTNGGASPFSNEIVDSIPPCTGCPPPSTNDPPPPPPTITGGPYDATAMVGTESGFWVSAVGAPPLTYQWFHGAMPIPGGVAPGELAISYTIVSNVSEASAGDYSVVVSNGGGSVTSRVVTLTVLPTLNTMSASLLPNQGMQLQFTGMPGATYLLLAATNLTPPVHWQSVATNLADAGGNCPFTVTNVQAMPACFFRTMFEMPFRTMSACLIPGQGVNLQFAGTPGRAYVLQATPSLNPPINWQPIATNFAGTFGNWSFTDTNALAMPARFYRTMLQ